MNREEWLFWRISTAKFATLPTSLDDLQASSSVMKGAFPFTDLQQIFMRKALSGRAVIPFAKLPVDQVFVDEIPGVQRCI